LSIWWLRVQIPPSSYSTQIAYLDKAIQVIQAIQAIWIYA
jgi:hypothetical protein